MIRSARILATVIAVVGLVAANGLAFSPSDDKGPNAKGQSSPSRGNKQLKDDSVQAPVSGIQFASYYQAQSQYIGTMWIGYGYIDEWGDEYIYWFPYAMIYDGDTGAIEYYPAY
jgi:hypothetical protein